MQHAARIALFILGSFMILQMAQAAESRHAEPSVSRKSGPVRIVITPGRTIGVVDRKVFGGFIENLEHCIYGGVYDPKSPVADADGFRKDIIEASRAMGISIIRFPGGCFAANYHWLDGIGPRKDRPKTKYSSYWPADNDFGTDEFIAWCRKIGAEPQICVNMGSGSPEEARNWVEYCNGPAGSKWADLRVKNGHPEPYNVKFWDIGNEVSGEWENGYAEKEEDYIRQAREFARGMKLVDPSIKLVLTGNLFPTYHARKNWNRAVLETLYPYIDYITMHYYVGQIGKSCVAGELTKAGPEAIHRRLTEGMMEVEDGYRVLREDIRLIKYHMPEQKQIGIALTEYNPNYSASYKTIDGLNCWFDLSDALAVGAFFNIFIRNADVATLSNMAQLVSVLPALQCKPGGAEFCRQGISYVQEMFLANRENTAVDVWVDSPTFKGDFQPAVPLIDASASFDQKNKRLVLNVINRSPGEAFTCELNVPGMHIKNITGQALGNMDLKTMNTFKEPQILAPHEVKAVQPDKITIDPKTVGVYTLFLE
jgi:alpha-L-arabinofuranosidase